MNMLWDNKTVNNYTVAVVSGFAVFNFFQSVGHMLFGDWFGTRDSWSWSEFWTDLVVLIVLLFVAMWINSRAKA